MSEVEIETLVTRVKITVGKSTCFYRLSQVDPEVAYLVKSRNKSTRLTRPILVLCQRGQDVEPMLSQRDRVKPLNERNHVKPTLLHHFVFFVSIDPSLVQYG